jgi:hypothetical protein
MSTKVSNFSIKITQQKFKFTPQARSEAHPCKELDKLEYYEYFIMTGTNPFILQGQSCGLDKKSKELHLIGIARS